MVICWCPLSNASVLGLNEVHKYIYGFVPYGVVAVFFLCVLVLCGIKQGILVLLSDYMLPPTGTFMLLIVKNVDCSLP